MTVSFDTDVVLLYGQDTVTVTVTFDKPGIVFELASGVVEDVAHGF